jgi:hypothetical protein
LANKLIDNLHDVDNSTMVALIVYGTTPQLVFNELNEVLDTASMQARINNATYPGSRTHTASALDLARTVLVEKASCRQAAVLITDGLSLDSRSVLSTAANSLRSDGVELYAINTMSHVHNPRQTPGLKAAAISELRHITNGIATDPHVIIRNGNDDDDDVVARITAAITDDDESIAPQVKWFELDMNVMRLKVGFTFPIASFKPSGITLSTSKGVNSANVTLSSSTQLDTFPNGEVEQDVIQIVLLPSDHAIIQQLIGGMQPPDLFMTTLANAYSDAHGNNVARVTSLAARRIQVDTVPVLLRAGNVKPGLLRLRFSEGIVEFDTSLVSMQNKILGDNIVSVQFPTGTISSKIFGRIDHQVELQFTVEALEFLRMSGLDGKVYIKIEAGAAIDVTGKSNERSMMLVTVIDQVIDPPCGGSGSGFGGSGSGCGDTTTTIASTTTTNQESTRTVRDCMDWRTTQFAVQMILRSQTIAMRNVLG